MNELHSFAEVASAVGRFEMESITNRGIRQERSVLGVSDLENFGLFRSSTIRACLQASTFAKQAALLDRIGEHDKFGWVLRAPSSSSDASDWAKLLASDHVVVFEADSSSEWLRKLIQSLYFPFVASVPPMALSEEWLAFERTSLKAAENVLHIASGGYRTSFTFVGVGNVYSEAVEFASTLKPLIWGYTTGAFRDALRSRKLIFRGRQ